MNSIIKFKMLAAYDFITKEILTYEIELNNSNNEFSMCASLGKMFDINDIKIDSIINFYDDFDFNWINIAKKLDINFDNISQANKKEILLYIADVDYNGDLYRLMKDCSCTEYLLIDSNNNSYNFETISTGQCCDELDNFSTKCNNAEYLKNLWQEYHLKTLPEYEIKKILEIKEEIENKNILEELNKIFIEKELN